MQYKDLLVSNYEIGLSKLTGKAIKEVRGYLARDFGEVSFKITEIDFEDGTQIGVEGEHDFPYLADYASQPQPNFDEETLERLYAEHEEDE